MTVVGRIDETTLPVGDALQVARDALEEDMSLGKVRPLVAIRQGEIGVSLPSPGFPSVQQAYREATLSLSYTSAVRPIVSLDDLSSLECALIGADATTRAVIASKGSELQALSAEELSVVTETIPAFSEADLNVARAAEQVHVHPNTVRYRLERIAATSGHDPRTFAGLVELLCILELIDSDPHG